MIGGLTGIDWKIEGGAGGKAKERQGGGWEKEIRNEDVGLREGLAGGMWRAEREGEKGEWEQKTKRKDRD